MNTISRIALLLAAATMLVSCAPRKSLLKGTVLETPQPAPDFRLLDQHGAPFHLADARGKVVLMTFIYTHCTDLCPYVALKMKVAYKLLGDRADQVVLVAVTTDPERDTQQAVAAYSQEAGLYDAWHYVIGTREQLKPVWAAYGIGVQAPPTEAEIEAEEHADHSHEEVAPAGVARNLTGGLTEDDVNLAGKLADEFGGGYEVGHSAPFWFVDKAGKLRATMDSDSLPVDISANLQVLSVE